MLEMKESKIEGIGLIPNEWDASKRIKDVFVSSKGLSITKEDLVDEGISVISYGQVHSKENTGTTIKPSLIRFVEERHIRGNAHSRVKKGDFIFADTSEDLEGCGNCCYVDCEDTIYAGYHTIIFKSLTKDNRFLAYLFKTDAWRLQIRKNVYAVKVYTVSQKILKECKIVLPPEWEQVSIANYLDEQCCKIDSILTDLESQIETLKAYKKALITETITKGLDKTKPTKDSGIISIGKIPQHWDAKRLKYALASSLQYGANETGDDYDKDNPRYIRITDITEDNELKDEGKQSLQIKLAKPYMLKDGDVLFARSGATVGKTFYYYSAYGPSAFAGYLIKADTNRAILNPRFLFYTTLGIGYENWKNTVFTQATIQNIGADKYAGLPVTLPPIDEQQEIIDYLDITCKELDEIMKVKNAQLETMREHKSAMIFEYVTGKKRVKEVQ